MKEQKFLFAGRFLLVTRYRVAVLFLFLFLSTSSIAFGVWEQTTNNYNDLITIGDFAQLVVISESTEDDEVRLVPLGAFKGRNDQDSLEFSYRVLFNQEGMLNGRIENVRFSGLDYLDFTFEVLGDSYNDSIEVILNEAMLERVDGVFVLDIKLSVTLLNQEDIVRLQNQPVLFDVVFYVSELSGDDDVE